MLRDHRKLKQDTEKQPRVEFPYPGEKEGLSGNEMADFPTPPFLLSSFLTVSYFRKNRTSFSWKFLYGW